MRYERKQAFTVSFEQSKMNTLSAIWVDKSRNSAIVDDILAAPCGQENNFAMIRALLQSNIPREFCEYF
jgi:hypothetical protein